MTDRIPSPRAVRERLNTHDTGLRARAIELIGDAKSTSITIKVQAAGPEEVTRVSTELQDSGWTVTAGKVDGAKVLVLTEPKRAEDDPRNDPNARIVQVPVESRQSAGAPPPSGAQNSPIATPDAKPR